MTEIMETTDAFLQIAQRTQDAQEGLIEPQPVPLASDQNFHLIPGHQAVCAAPLPRNDAWFDAELARLHEVWKPFLANHAPGLGSVRQRQILSDFDWRLDNEPRPDRLPEALAGAGEWKQVEVPHYDGPIGRATSFYRSVFTIDAAPAGQRNWLHFEGADYLAKVYLNGNYIGQHEGIVGWFEFDVTDYIIPGSENELVVQLENDAIMMGNDMWDSKDAGDKIYAATGPGWDDPETGWHHCPAGMGIYRKVYLETRPEVFIEDGWVRPLLSESMIELWLEVQSRAVLSEALSAKIKVFGKNFKATIMPELNVELRGKPGVGRNYYRVRLPLETDQLWSPETPWLHTLQVSIGEDTQAFDFGMREFRLDTYGEPKGQFSLNGKPVRLRGVNTMGHEQLSVMAGDMEQLLDDMLIYKMMGLNYIRFTQRPVDREVLELCDALGLMAQSDLPMFKNVRRNQFNEAVRQATELERFSRRHASVVVTSFINEPFPLIWHNALHRHLGKAELEAFFASATTAILQENPDRVIKPIDGDYDPPSAGLPDHHCYTLWYNGHMIPYGRLETGYWQPIKPGWNYACGEYGAEGLDPVDLMRRRYPAKWLPQTEDEEKNWTPHQIRKAQSGDVYHVFYDKPDTLEGWVEASQEFQAWTITSMTEAFRRDPRMISFALHLGIDAFPSGWMKTIVDCERRPKKGFFAFRDALAPVLPTLRAPRRFWWADERFEAELWVSNDRPEAKGGLQLRAELRNGGEVLAALIEDLPELPSCDAQGVGQLSFDLPKTEKRTACSVCIQVVTCDGDLIGQSSFDFDVFASVSSLPRWSVPSELTEGMVERAQAGATVLCSGLEEGDYNVGGVKFSISPIGMGSLIFCSRATGHSLVDGFEPNDFRLWYDETVGYASDFADNVIIGEGWEPILNAGRGHFGEAWSSRPVVAEKKVGKGRIILCQLNLNGRITKNPPAAIFAQSLMNFESE